MGLRRRAGNCPGKKKFSQSSKNLLALEKEDRMVWNESNLMMLLPWKALCSWSFPMSSYLLLNIQSRDRHFVPETTTVLVGLQNKASIAKESK